MRTADIESIRTAMVVAGIATPDQGRTFIEAMRVPPQKKRELTVVWTDGACAFNPGGGGGYAAVVVTPRGKKRAVVGGELSTTNNRMELRAVIEGLRSLPPSDVLVMSDAQYVVKGAMSWIKLWRRNGWQTRQKQEVVNRDLWEQLDKELARHTRVEFKWVRGHAGNPLNEEADLLAEEEAQRQEDAAHQDDDDMPDNVVEMLRSP